MLKAVLFGSMTTLVETSELERQAFNLAFAEHALDLEWNAIEFRRLMQTHGRQICLETVFGPEKVELAEGLHRSKAEFFKDLLDHEDVRLRREVGQAIAFLRSKGVSMGLVSGAARQTVNRVRSAALGIYASSTFQVVTSQELGLPAKPHPALYEFALKELGVTADACLAIEAGEDGAAAAASAGLPLIVFPESAVQSCRNSLLSELTGYIEGHARPIAPGNIFITPART